MITISISYLPSNAARIQSSDRDQPVSARIYGSVFINNAFLNTDNKSLMISLEPYKNNASLSPQVAS